MILRTLCWSEFPSTRSITAPSNSRPHPWTSVPSRDSAVGSPIRKRTSTILSMSGSQMDTSLARERLALERAKFEFNAAREALNHRTQLGQILANPHADDEAKIQAARERIFGKESVARIAAQERKGRNDQ